MSEKFNSFLLSFISGFIDTAGFIVLSGLFTAHITGNLVLAGASLVKDNNAEVFVRLAMLPFFIIGVMLTFILGTNLTKKLKPSLLILIILQTVLVVLFSTIGLLFENNTHEIFNPWHLFLVGTIGVLAMSVQNTYMKTHLTTYVPTTVMTGNLTQFSMDLVDLIETKLNFADSSNTQPTNAQLTLAIIRLGLSLLGFLVGAIIGAILVVEIGLICCLGPALLLIVLAYFCPKQSTPAVV